MLAGDSSSKGLQFASKERPERKPVPPRLAGEPAVGDFLIFQVPHAGDEAGMVVLSPPIDRLLLFLESREQMAAWSSTAKSSTALPCGRPLGRAST
jgi:hypothetical protein